MKKTLILILFFLIANHADFAQRTQIIESLRKELRASKQDTSKVMIMADLSFMLRFYNPDSSVVYAQIALDLANRIGYIKGQARALNSLGTGYTTMGEIAKALKFQFQGLQLAEEQHFLPEAAMCLLEIGIIYGNFDPLIAIDYFKQARVLNDSDQNDKGHGFLRDRIDLNIGIHYLKLNQLDSAFTYLHNTYNRTLTSDFFHAPLLLFLGKLQFELGNKSMAINYLHQSIGIDRQNKDYYTGSDAYVALALIYSKLNMPDSSIYFAKKSLEEAQAIDFKNNILQSSNLLATLYESRDINEAHRFLRIAYTASKELYGPEKINGLQKQISEEQERQRNNEAENIAYQNRIKQYFLFGALGIFFLIAFILYHNNGQKQKANKVLESTLANLKATQAQLIHSEKMASLGELTAGIAHEIKNPLNFVNNFSEVSADLITEMLEEADKGNTEEVKAIAEDLKQNLEKINHHGKRADSIVKGMLLHSRGTAGEKTPTDINDLLEQYVNLAYHGMRAQNKDFNIKIERDYDKTLDKINVVPQDISRVFLNIINNGCYAANDKKKTMGDDFSPTIKVSTKNLKDKVEIRISDNGNGIPDKIKDKLFQPFFTTKPTGEGTGLGLSLSYDIVTKQHNGEIKIESKVGEGSEFVITLPCG